jgi:hypothetical protein
MEIPSPVNERLTSSGLSTVGNRTGHLGKGMNSDRKWRPSVLMKKKRKAEAWDATLAAVNFRV